MSDSMKVITNNQERLILDAYELTPKERKEFDYLDWDAIDEGRDSASFVRYKGRLYDLAEFQVTQGNEALKDWHGFAADTFFSATLVRFADEDHVIMGRCYS